MGDTGSERSKPPGLPPRCSCGFWGSSKTMNLCSKCFAVAEQFGVSRSDVQKKQPDEDSSPGPTPSTSSSQSDVFTSDMNSSSSSPSFSSQTVSNPQPLPSETNVASLPSQEEWNSARGLQLGFSLQVVLHPLPLKEQGAPENNGVLEFLLPGKEENLHTPAAAEGEDISAIVEAPAAKAQPSLSQLPMPKGVPCTDTAHGTLATPTKRPCESGSVSEGEESPGKRARLQDDVAEESRGGTKQRSRRRCYRCQTKLELVQQELGSCRCGYVFCMLHRLPEQHDCLFDHLGRGREEAILKMVKLDRKVGRSCQRIGEECS
ncbi:ZFAN3 protein, partial [Polyodon spathula]|nr:ZFAN3 protein [Polyodon spathula]